MDAGAPGRRGAAVWAGPRPRLRGGTSAPHGRRRECQATAEKEEGGFMKTRKLGKSGIQVTEFCLGLLPMGVSQLNLPEEKGAEIVRAALDGGVNFFDTAKSYRTQPFLNSGLGGRTDQAVIATKSGAASESAMAEDVERALRELGRDYIDVFHLHAARARKPFTERAGAHKRLLKLKEEGVVRAVGVSTHYVKVVRDAAGRDDIDVVFPLTNLTGMGILDGGADDMAAAICEAAHAGLGVYVMKPLAGGNLLSCFKEALAYARELEGVSSVSLGVVLTEELRFALRIFNDEPITDDDYEKTAKTPKRYIILRGCNGCGICLDECPAEAMDIREDKAHITRDKCILCGYCATACPDFWIRVV